MLVLFIKKTTLLSIAFQHSLAHFPIIFLLFCKITAVMEDFEEITI